MQDHLPHPGEWFALPQGMLAAGAERYGTANFVKALQDARLLEQAGFMKAFEIERKKIMDAIYSRFVEDMLADCSCYICEEEKRKRQNVRPYKFVADKKIGIPEQIIKVPLTADTWMVSGRPKETPVPGLYIGNAPVTVEIRSTTYTRRKIKTQSANGGSRVVAEFFAPYDVTDEAAIALLAGN